MLIAAFVSNLFDLLVLALFAPETVATFWINALILGFTLLSFWLLRRGQVRTSSLIICLSTWGLLTGYLAVSGGVLSPAFGFLDVLIIVGAVLLGRRGALLQGFLCFLSAVFLYISAENGWLPMVESHPTPGRLLATQSAIFLALTLIMAISMQSVRNALVRAWQDERSLAERNRELQSEIARREQAQQEQARLATILEASSDMVAMADPDGRLIYMNPAYRRTMGVSASADLSEIDLADFYPSHILNLFVETAIPAAIRDGVWTGETVLRLPDGKEIPVLQMVIAHKNADGTLELLASIMRDISDRKRAEAEQLELARQKERLESFKEFISNLSHDFKTPMTIINTSLHLLERLDDPERRREKLESIHEQINLLDRYIHNLMLLTRLDREPDFSFRQIDLNRLMRDVQQGFAPVAEAKRITIVLELDPTLPDVMADEQELYRAAANLMENAINYTLGGGSVTLRTYAQAGGVIAQISDTGIGIAPEEIPHIFDRFYRSTRAHQIRAGGTGLGLAITRRIIEVHGGRIEVESNPGKGSAFRIWLPAANETVETPTK